MKNDDWQAQVERAEERVRDAERQVARIRRYAIGLASLDRVSPCDAVDTALAAAGRLIIDALGRPRVTPDKTGGLPPAEQERGPA